MASANAVPGGGGRDCGSFESLTALYVASHAQRVGLVRGCRGVAGAALCGSIGCADAVCDQRLSCSACQVKRKCSVLTRV